MNRSEPWRGRVDGAIAAGAGPSARTLHSVRLGAAAGVADQVTTELSTSLLGLGPLAPLTEDPRVTDILVNPDGRVFVDRGEGVSPAGHTLEAPQARALAVRLAGLTGRRLDDAQPWVDGHLGEGLRLHAVLPPITGPGAAISLRLPRHQPDGVAGLVAIGTLVGEFASVLRDLVAARVSFLVTGGTGSGKTTVLAALLAECADDERIVVCEDVRELSPRHPHVISLQGRATNVEGTGQVTLVDLVRQALRMRPDRLVVGEVRGAEVRELLTALNTGHQGGGGTVHANAPEDVPRRIEALAALAGLTRAGAHAQLLGAIEAVIHCERRGTRRHVESVSVVVERSGAPVVLRALTLERAGRERTVHGPGWEHLARRLREAGR